MVRLKRSGRQLPQSLLGSAIDYALGLWPTLKVYLDDGRLEIDNNLVENAIRPTALGKKIGSSSATRMLASEARSFTPLLKLVGVAASIPIPISKTC